MRQLVVAGVLMVAVIGGFVDPLRADGKPAVVDDMYHAVTTLRDLNSLGIAIETYEGSVIDHYVLSQEIMRRAYERIAAGELKVSIDHGLSAAKIVSDIEARTGIPVDATVYVEAFGLFFDELAARTTEEFMVDFAHALKANPTLRSLISRAEGDPIEVEAREEPPDDPDPIETSNDLAVRVDD